MDSIKTNLIIDTDIGEDIDDTWSLVFLLSSQFVDIKLICVSTGDVTYKAKIVAKILSKLHMTHIPICLGVKSEIEEYSQLDWVKDFDLSNYEGTIYKNAHDAFKHAIDETQSVTILEIAPMSTISKYKALFENPKIRLIAMAGSIYQGYFKSKEPSIECNVVRDIEAAKNILTSNINVTLVPLDVCNDFVVDNESYQKIFSSDIIRSKIVIENYLIWSKKYIGNANSFDPNKSSSILYDLLASFVILFPQYFDYLHIPIEVSNEGYTKVGGDKLINVAIKKHKTDAMILTVVERFNTDIETNKNILKLSVPDMYSLTYLLQTPNPSLFVTEIGWEQRHSGSNFGPMERDYYILHFTVSGKGMLNVDGKEYPFKGGDIFLVPPHIKVSYSADQQDPCKYYWVAYSGLMANELTMKTGLTINNTYILSPTNFEEICAILAKMNNLDTSNTGVTYELLGELYIIFSKLFSKSNDSFIEEKSHVKRIVEYLETHYQEKLTVNDLSKYMSLDRTYIYKLFKKQIGISIKEYLMNLRIEKAKDLLVNSNQPIYMIATLVGYSNNLSFNKTFKSKLGMSPKLYRKSNKQQKLY